METRECKDCHVVKPLTEAYFGSCGRNKAGETIYRYSCRDCRNQYSRTLWHRPGYKEKVAAATRQTYKETGKGFNNLNRKKRLKWNWGLSWEDYIVMLASQDNKCAICRNEVGDDRRTILCVDHCHETNVIRGLLCPKCNRGLGHFHDRIDLLLAAILYLCKAKDTQRVSCLEHPSCNLPRRSPEPSPN